MFLISGFNVSQDLWMPTRYIFTQKEKEAAKYIKETQKCFESD